MIAIDTAMYAVPLQTGKPGRDHGRAFGSDGDTWIRVSPWHNVGAGERIPPFLPFVSDGRPSLRDQVLPLQRGLEEAGVEASDFEAKGRSHSPLDTVLGVPGDESTTLLTDFLVRHSGGLC